LPFKFQLAPLHLVPAGDEKEEKKTQSLNEPVAKRQKKEEAAMDAKRKAQKQQLRNAPAVGLCRLNQVDP
jgi:hypothetical protein